jgi:8-oxo-dGTP diphosphatase
MLSSLNIHMIIVAGGIIEKDNKILIAQRHRNDTHGLKWEFPGGTLRNGESGEDGIIREIHEELGLNVEVLGYYGSYTEGKLRILYYRVKPVSGSLKLTEHEQAHWVTKDQLLEYDLLSGDQLIANRLHSI